MITVFQPTLTFWLADDGRIFSGPSQSVVAADDAGYVAYLASGSIARPWPRDAQGDQTTAALQEILGSYGMFADLKAYAASLRYNKEVGGTSVAGVGYPTDRETQAKLTAAALFAQVDPTQTFTWKLADGTFTAPLTAAQMVGIAAAIGGFVNACFATEQTVAAAIDAGTITTAAQVDAAFA